MSSKGIKISPKYGVNPTIPVCFWCGRDKNEIALMGKVGNGSSDIQMPTRCVIDYNPCEDCAAAMSQGVTVMSATNRPNEVTTVEFQSGVYPTGRWVVLTRDAAKKIFNKDDIDKCFVDSTEFDRIFGSREESDF